MLTRVSDPFSTAGLRKRVLSAWSASPARFREDANAEESLAVGGYAGRALVELIANGVDAAVAAGVPTLAVPHVVPVPLTVGAVQLPSLRGLRPQDLLAVFDGARQSSAGTT